MENGVKKWKVTYAHADGRSGSVECKTEVQDSGCFQYGNGKSGGLTVGDFFQGYDLRYAGGGDLHMIMLDDYFGRGLVKAEEI